MRIVECEQARESLDRGHFLVDSSWRSLCLEFSRARESSRTIDPESSTHLLLSSSKKNSIHPVLSFPVSFCLFVQYTVNKLLLFYRFVVVFILKFHCSWETFPNTIFHNVQIHHVLPTLWWSINHFSYYCNYDETHPLKTILFLKYSLPDTVFRHNCLCNFINTWFPYLFTLRWISTSLIFVFKVFLIFIPMFV